MVAVLNPRRTKLAARLREIRTAAFPSGSAFAREIGWAQPRVSKLETGTQLPTEADIHAWAATSGAGEQVEAELLDLLSAARMEYANSRDVQRSTGGLTGRQASLRALEQTTTHIADYKPGMIPGLLQTPAYAHALLTLTGGPVADGATPEDIDRLVAARIERQTILYQPGKHIQLVIGEAALRNRPGTVDTMRGQLDRLLMISQLETVTLGILPLDAPLAIMPLCSFTIHDDTFVLIETLTAELRLDEPEEVAVYSAAFRTLLENAVTGTEAIELIRRVKL